jgi:hypothetical protein
MITFRLQSDGTVEALNGSRRKVYQWQRTPLEYQGFYLLEIVAGHREAKQRLRAFLPVLREHWRKPTATITDEEIRTWLAFERTKVSASTEAQNEKIPA